MIDQLEARRATEDSLIRKTIETRESKQMNGLKWVQRTRVEFTRFGTKRGFLQQHTHTYSYSTQRYFRCWFRNVLKRLANLLVTTKQMASRSAAAAVVGNTLLN